MDIIPVLDLAGGVAVWAQAGDRARYEPVASALIPSVVGDPVALLGAFRARLGAIACYVADLDAIQGGAVQRTILRELAQLETGFAGAIMVDAGAHTPESTLEVMACGASLRSRVMSKIIEKINQEQVKKDVTTFNVGDSVKVDLPDALIDEEIRRRSLEDKLEEDLFQPLSNQLVEAMIDFDQQRFEKVFANDWAGQAQHTPTHRARLNRRRGFGCHLGIGELWQVILQLD